MPQTSFPTFIPQKKVMCCAASLGGSHLFLCPPLSNSTRNFLLFGFKNRTFKLDFYGLGKNTVLVPTHTWSLPLPGLVQPLSGPLRGDLVDLRGQPWPRPSSHGSQPPFSSSPTSHAARGWDILCLSLPPPQLAESALVQPCAGAGTPHARAFFGLTAAMVALGLPVLGLESAWSIPSC